MKKILHVCLANYYADNYGYQENILPREHKKLGYDVRILASTETFLDNHKLGYTKSGTYSNEDGIEVTRIPYMWYIPKKLVRKLRLYEQIDNYLTHYNPDVVFFHDVQFLSIIQFVKFFRTRNDIKVYADSHTDFNNSARNWISKRILHGLIYKYCVMIIDPYVIKYWGVLPAREKFYIDVYGVNKQKVNLLVMGAEDDKVKSSKVKGKENIRERYNIAQDELVIVTGGKIDHNKIEVLNLMKAIQQVNFKKLKLVIFGSVSAEIEEQFNSLLSRQITFIGWLTTDETYDAIEMADVVIFPGLHSVHWEQAIGMGKPCLFRYINGFEHVDVNGNCRFIYQNSVEELKNIIEILLKDNCKELMEMTSYAEKCMSLFSYTEIAKRSIEI